MVYPLGCRAEFVVLGSLVGITQHLRTPTPSPFHLSWIILDYLGASCDVALAAISSFEGRETRTTPAFGSARPSQVARHPMFLKLVPGFAQQCQSNTCRVQSLDRISCWPNPRSLEEEALPFLYGLYYL